MTLEVAVWKVIVEYAEQHDCSIDEAKEAVRLASSKIYNKRGTKNEK